MCEVKNKRYFHFQFFQQFDDFYLGLEEDFLQMQTYKSIFILELIFAIYILLNLAIIADLFMMPSLASISKRYHLSKDITGIMVAIGSSVPELTTTILSFMRHGVKMTEFGVISNLGCSMFSLTMVPALAVLFVT
jgi:Ca2+/Na+ antiporter